MRRNTTATPAGPHTRRTLFQSSSISAVDFCCIAPVQTEGPEEPNPTHSIVFVRNGVFGRAEGRHTLIADSNYILFFNEAQPYRFSHPVSGGDRCTILTVATPTALDLVSGFQPRDAESFARPFRIGHGIISRRAAWLHYELLALVKRTVSALEVDDVLAELSDEAVRTGYKTHDRGTDDQSSKSPARRQQRDLVEAAKVAINRELDSVPSLSQLACALGCSSFHLSRIFHRITGLSLRRYVARLRVLAAAERLAGGMPDLTELALDLGYSDHSHLTNSFRREWGLPPSRFRERHVTGNRGKNLQAAGKNLRHS
jgi:AraC family transcriptional regulator